MSDCKVKISVDICGESALNKVSLLIAEQDKIGDMSPKLSIRDICKQVAEEFNTANEGAHVKWETLRKAYQRAQKVGTCPQSTEKLVHVPTLEKELVPLDVPIINSTTECVIDTTKYITIEEHTEKMLKLEKRIEQLQKTIEDMLPIVDKAMQFELKETIIDSAPEKSTLLPREMIFDFIKQKGNSIQCHALKSDDLTNEKLYSIFVKVREDYKASTPPPAWDTSVTTATGIL